MSHSPYHYLPGLLVKYAGATDTKGSRWIATLTRGIGAENRYRASVPYADGPDAAAAAVVARFNEVMGTAWRIDPTALSLDGTTTFAYGCLTAY
jgi:hypothetical protein